MGLGVVIKEAGLEQAVRAIKTLPKQGRFAASVAINRTLLNVQEWTIDELLPGVFTLRSRGRPWQRPRTKFGFNIKPFASKHRLEAKLGSQADWLELQEAGGLKRVGGHRLAIPTKFWKPPKELMRRRKKPKRILGGRKVRGLKGKPFIYEGGKMPAGIYARETKERQPIRMLFHFVDEARIAATLRFESAAKLQAESTFPDEFQRAFLKAIATAR